MKNLSGCLARPRSGGVIWNDERGVTALEYGMIAALIAVVIVASVSLIGTNLGTAFSTIASNVTP